MAIVLISFDLDNWIDHFLGPQNSTMAWWIFVFLGLFLLAVLLVVLAIIFRTLKGSWDLFRFLRSTRDKYFVCTNCGYDLRHKPDRCPECGQKVWFRDRRKTSSPVPPVSTSTLEIPDPAGDQDPDKEADSLRG